METTLNPQRRRFLKMLATGAASTTVLLVYRSSSSSAETETKPNASAEDGPKHNYAYVINVGNCIGCGSCVRACSAENDVPAGVFRTWVERFIKTDEGVYMDSPNGSADGFVEADQSVVEASLESWFVPKMCNHCHNPPCVHVCPVGATFQTEEGFVLVDDKHCIGCGYCVQGCPYSARYMNPKTHVADKCTWCYHRVKRGKLPACVTVCPTKARLFGDLNDETSEVARIFGERRWLVLKPDQNTDNYCFYIDLPEEVV